MTTEHRIVAFWDAGETKNYFFMSTLCHDFNEAFQEMVEEMGTPSRIEFRASDEGWSRTVLDSRPYLTASRQQDKI